MDKATVRAKAFLSNKNGVLCKEFARMLSHLYGNNLGKLVFIAAAVNLESCRISLTYGTPFVKSVKFTPPGGATVAFDASNSWVDHLHRLHSYTINVQLSDRRVDVVLCVYNQDSESSAHPPLLTRNISLNPAPKDYGTAYDALCRGEDIQIVDL